MLLKILRFFFGYIRLEIYGFAPERFMNLIINNNIIIWEVEITDQGYIFYTGRKNYIDMKPFLQKTNIKTKILGKYGLPYLIKTNRKRIPFLAGFGIFAISIYLLSLFVWEVKVNGEDKLVAETILKQIENEYVSLGTLKSKVNCAMLEEELRNDFQEISWISCELKGTVLTVYLEEGMLSEQKETKRKCGDLVASKDAVITKMITREGTPMVKVKDTVKKGDILVSGTIYIYDDNNEVLETSYIAADGDVYGKTTYSYEDYVELKYYQKSYNENYEQYYTFYFLNYCFTPYTPKQPDGNYDIYTEIQKAKIMDNFYLPFGYKKIKWTPYQLEYKTYTEKEAATILKNRLNKKIQSFREKGVEIIENDVKIERNGEKLVAKGNLTLKESIATFKTTSNIISTEENNETDRR